MSYEYVDNYYVDWMLNGVKTEDGLTQEFKEECSKIFRFKRECLRMVYLRRLRIFNTANVDAKMQSQIIKASLEKDILKTRDTPNKTNPVIYKVICDIRRHGVEGIETMEINTPRVRLAGKRFIYPTRYVGLCNKFLDDPYASDAFEFYKQVMNPQVYKYKWAKKGLEDISNSPLQNLEKLIKGLPGCDIQTPYGCKSPPRNNYLGFKKGRKMFDVFILADRPFLSRSYGTSDLAFWTEWKHGRLQILYQYEMKKLYPEMKRRVWNLNIPIEKALTMRYPTPLKGHDWNYGRRTDWYV